MPVSDWPTNRVAEADRLQAELRAEQDQNLLLTESLADLQLALDDRGWQSIASSVDQDFTPEARKAMIKLCRSMAVANPLIKRGLQIRKGYIWGQGVQVRARAAGEKASQDVNAVVQAFWDANKITFTGDDSHDQAEQTLGTDGNVFVVGFTNPLTGSVRVRTALVEEIADIINNPDDRDEPWYYVRHVPKKHVEPGVLGARTRNEIEKVVHPAMGFYPKQRPKTVDGMQVRWDAPMLHIKVNPVAGWRFGVPDVYAALAWARSYRDFLVDWAQLTHSLSQIAWQATAGTASRAAKVAQGLTAGTQRGHGSIGDIPPVGAGRAAVGTPDVKLEAVSKSGATIDANSGKPLAGMAAAGMGVPVTMLLADPGITGARAVAETLDLPTILEMGGRRLLWQAKLTQLLTYVVDQAVMAPRGPLRGTLVRDEWGQLSTVLAGEVEKTLDWEWPPLVNTDPVELIKAIVEANGTNLLPDLVTLRLLLNALGVKDVDEILAGVTDDEGNFVDQKLQTVADAVEARRLARA